MLMIGYSVVHAQQNPMPAAALYRGEAAAEEVPRDLRHASYPELGLLLSTPLVNPAVGYWFGPYGVRVSGMYLAEDLYKFHLNLGYKRLDNARKQRSLNIVLNRVEDSDPGADYDFTSIGVAYGWNSIFGVRGLFAQLGLAKAIHDNLGNVIDELFLPCVQIGYIHRFTPK